MKRTELLLLIALLVTACTPKDKDTGGDNQRGQTIVTSDIDHFWEAYDLIRSTDDSLKQLEYLQSLFLEKATQGQRRMIAARNYTADDYLGTIKNHPSFWNSIRSNTEKVASFNEELKEGVDKLRGVYPDLSYSTIYYTVGTHRSPGTGVDSLVLIGTEFALGDSTDTDSRGLREHLQNYYKINPVDHLQFLTVHEYVHTQQQEMVHNLLCLTLYEGIAEFVAMVATDRRSPFKSMQYGPDNDERIRLRFEEEMFVSGTTYDWLWNGTNNEFGTADLGYYVGSVIASKYYESTSNKKDAIKALIELDFSDDAAVEALVDGTGYFSKPLKELYEDFESSRPQVLRIEQFDNESSDVDALMKRITLHFSEPMDQATRGFDFGPLGEEHVLRVQNVVGFSDDGRAFTFEVSLEPGKRYQSLVTNRFLSTGGVPLKPFLIEFTTRE